MHQHISKSRRRKFKEAVAADNDPAEAQVVPEERADGLPNRQIVQASWKARKTHTHTTKTEASGSDTLRPDMTDMGPCLEELGGDLFDALQDVTAEEESFEVHQMEELQAVLQSSCNVGQATCKQQKQQYQ